MSTTCNPFVEYLNRLHNYNAQNQNAYEEKNVESPYYKETVVKSSRVEMIKRVLSEEQPHIFILTGYAGDGKTSIMYQFLKAYGTEFEKNQDSMEVNLNGNICYCIKDFSELPDDTKLAVLQKVIRYPKDGKYAFIVANTGPLIKTFSKLFSGKEAEEATAELIKAMEENFMGIRKIKSYPFVIFNLANVDNTGFVKDYLPKLIKNDKLWEDCNNCGKARYCHIKWNREVIKEHFDSVTEFITKYYIWLDEYGYRLTVRSIIEQLAYMITGGDVCQNISQQIHIDKNAFYNLFFGYYGAIPNDKAAITIYAIKLAQKNNLYNQRLRADERLFVQKDYKSLFKEQVYCIIKKGNADRGKEYGWRGELRRAYFFLGLNDTVQKQEAYEDIFSKCFPEYVRIRELGDHPKKDFTDLICDAIRMINQGYIDKGHDIPITLSKGDGISQCVQLVLGFLVRKDIKIKTDKCEDGSLSKHQLTFSLGKGDNHSISLSLPMINYFYELKNGIISTNIDPQLSRGVESIIAKLISFVSEFEDDGEDDGDIQLIIRTNRGAKLVNGSFKDGVIDLV